MQMTNLLKQVLKVTYFDKKAASPPHMDGSLVYARLRLATIHCENLERAHVVNVHPI